MARLFIFTTSSCEAGQRLRQQLRQEQIGYRVVDMETDQGSLLGDQLGVRRLPALFVHDGACYHRVARPTVRSAKAALKRHAQPETCFG